MVRRGAWRMVEVGGGWWRSAPLLVAAISSTVLHRPPPTSRTQSPVVLLATTTSTRDAGLLDSLPPAFERQDRKSTRLNSSHGYISYAVFCLKKKKTNPQQTH